MAAALKFGPWPIDVKEVFLHTGLSFAFVNYKPVVPGHVLVAPRRVVARFADLTPQEVSDMWLTAQRVAIAVQALHNAPAATFALQDGPEAGQTVPHVHVHVLPRAAADFARNDDVYTAVEAHDKAANHRSPPDAAGGAAVDAKDDGRKPRTIEDMACEAELIRKKLEPQDAIKPE